MKARTWRLVEELLDWAVEERSQAERDPEVFIDEAKVRAPQVDSIDLRKALEDLRDDPNFVTSEAARADH